VLLSVQFACTVPREPVAERAPAAPPPAPAIRELTVTATAYNSTVAQTDAKPTIAAWGSELRSGMQIIAVSPDLEAQGLTRGAVVAIEGLEGEWVVADRMPSRRRLSIDVYMGDDVEGARAFGKRRVLVKWQPGPELAESRAAE
jgi:3D (Asp-Asp-Asp) domain-containing protein